MDVTNCIHQRGSRVAKASDAPISAFTHHHAMTFEFISRSIPGRHRSWDRMKVLSALLLRPSSAHGDSPRIAPRPTTH